MRKFHFPFNTLLKVRKEKENLAQKLLLEAHIVMQEKLNRLEKFREEKEKLVNQIRSQKSGANDPLACASAYQYLEVLKEKIIFQQGLLSEAEEMVARCRQNVIRAVQQRKIIENLHDKRLEEWEYEVSKADKAICDEIATIRYIRNNPDKKEQL
jgi:flagellar FliJ protein